MIPFSLISLLRGFPPPAEAVPTLGVLCSNKVSGSGDWTLTLTVSRLASDEPGARVGKS